jgi:hypothetical protein
LVSEIVSISGSSSIFFEAFLGAIVFCSKISKQTGLLNVEPAQKKRKAQYCFRYLYQRRV